MGLTFCKKDKEVIIENPPIVPDSIIYTDLIPDTSVCSIRNNWPLADLPPPWDTSASIQLDVDSDNINDISISASIFYQFLSASNPDVNYTRYLEIGMIRVTDSLASYAYQWCSSIPRVFPKDSIIGINSTYSKGGYLYSSGGDSEPCSSATTGDSYCGFKIYGNGGYYYGWILLKRSGSVKVTVKEFAINKTINNSIKAGQKN